MKAYFRRLMDGTKLWQRIFWAVFRLLMLYAFFDGLLNSDDITDPLQVGSNILCMLAWEIFQLFPAKSVFRYLPSSTQNVSTVLIFCASFCGKYLNFYYDVRFWDSALHFLCGGIMVLCGYEVVVCLQKRDKVKVSLPIAILCAVGFSFFVSTLWELFEFTFDQIALMMGGDGDAQHWSYALAKGTAKVATLIDPVDPARWPLMDTMGDIILNSGGAVLGYIFLKVFPYRHRGADNVNDMFETVAEACK